MSELSIRERAERSVEFLRVKRKRLFKAFDIYKQNVAYGLIPESQERHQELVNWYSKALDLNYDAISNPPQEVKKYL